MGVAIGATDGVVHHGGEVERPLIAGHPVTGSEGREVGTRLRVIRRMVQHVDRREIVWNGLVEALDAASEQIAPILGRNDYRDAQASRDLVADVETVGVVRGDDVSLT